MENVRATNQPGGDGKYKIPVGTRAKNDGISIEWSIQLKSSLWILNEYMYNRSDRVCVCVCVRCECAIY